MIDKRPCALCDEQVGGDNSETWGFQWRALWFHHTCIEKLLDASYRIQAAERHDPDEAGPGMRAVEVS